MQSETKGSVCYKDTKMKNSRGKSRLCIRFEFATNTNARRSPLESRDASNTHDDLKMTIAVLIPLIIAIQLWMDLAKSEMTPNISPGTLLLVK